ncbi:MAG: TetR/AcrR family transcriptional regulator [Planctomycetota bacterium]|jgi:AcrR family transcriptional regulator
MARTVRLSREDWLAGALGVLQERGIGALRVRTLAKALGVTMGSFYWHFESTEDFKRALLVYWRDELTGRYIRDAQASSDEPGEQLRAITEALDESRVARFEAVVRAWAAYDPDVRGVVEAVDHMRLEFLLDLFGRLGFRGVDRELRARLLMHYQMAEPLVLAAPSEARRRSLRRSRLRFLTDRRASS